MMIGILKSIFKRKPPKLYPAGIVTLNRNHPDEIRGVVLIRENGMLAGIYTGVIGPDGSSTGIFRDGHPAALGYDVQWGHGPLVEVG